MFDVGNFGSTWNGGPVNGFDLMLMNSQKNLETVLPEFKKAIKAGYNPNFIKDEIFEKYGITDDDFTDEDANTLIREVESMCRRYL